MRLYRGDRDLGVMRMNIITLILTNEKLGTE